MSDIKLFRLSAGKAIELQGDASDLEKPLQTLIEANLETLLGIRFLASEYSTGKTHAGRIDSLGLDENSCPAILEYDLELALTSQADLDSAKPLILMAYEGRGAIAASKALQATES